MKLELECDTCLMTFALAKTDGSHLFRSLNFKVGMSHFFKSLLEQNKEINDISAIRGSKDGEIKHTHSGCPSVIPFLYA